MDFHPADAPPTSDRPLTPGAAAPPADEHANGALPPGDRQQASPPGIPVDPEFDARQESDLWLGAYSGWTMLPSSTICLVLMLLIALGTHLLWTAAGLDYLTMRYTAYSLIALLALAQLGYLFYWTVTYSYRLTTRRVLVERAFFSGKRAHLRLEDVGAVCLERSRLQWLLGVGTVRVEPRSATEPALVLAGVSHPEQVASLLRKLSKRARAGEVILAPPSSSRDAPLTAGHIEGDI